MPEKDGFACGGLVYAKSDGGWQQLGHVGEDGISLSTDEETELSAYAQILSELPCQSFTLTIPWWGMNRFLRVFGSSRWPAYTVRNLRRGGKSHKKARLW